MNLLLLMLKISSKLLMLRWTEITKGHKGKRDHRKFLSNLIGTSKLLMIKGMMKIHQYFIKKILLKLAQLITTVMIIEQIKTFKVIDVIDKPNKTKNKDISIILLLDKVNFLLNYFLSNPLIKRLFIV